MNIENPIFICGHIKTGTSLMTSLLDSHIDLLVFPEELYILSKLEYLRKNNLKEYKDFWEFFFYSVQIRKMFGNKSTGFFGNVDYTNFDAHKFKKICLEKTQNLSFDDKIAITIYETIFKSYLEVKQDDEKKRWVEKTPMNEFNFHLWINAYPGAQFIYMKRNPFEVFTSVKKKRMIENKNYSIFNFITKYKTSLKVAYKLKNKYPNNFKIVELDKLKKNTKSTMREICTFLNIKFTDNILKPTKLGVTWKGNSMYSNNNSAKIHENTHYENRIRTITEREYLLIKKYLVNQKIPLFDPDFLKYSLKAYLKVRLTNLWVIYFLRRSKKI